MKKEKKSKEEILKLTKEREERLKKYVGNPSLTSSDREKQFTESCPKSRGINPWGS